MTDFPIALGQRPTWLQILDCFAHELDAKQLLAWAYSVKQRQDTETASELGFLLAHYGTSKVREFARQQERAKPASEPTSLSPEQKKTIVLNALGHDPGKPKPGTWCFPYKPAPFDISDFPDAPKR